MTDNTLGGRIQFEIATASFFTDMQQEALQERFDNELPNLSAKEKEQVEQFVFWYSVTESIVFNFDGREKKGLKNFKANWERRAEMTTRELLDFWLKLPFEIRTAWITEASAGQGLFEVDAAQLPTVALTDTQRKELEDPTSPLVSAG